MPCSGEGGKDRCVENWSPESNQQIAETQRELIDSAFHALRPGRHLSLVPLDLHSLNGKRTEEVVQWLLPAWLSAGGRGATARHACSLQLWRP